ncbi:MAG: hypothetical protein WCH76_04505 [Candidatus Riflemargulisbacteria bacterium]
MSISAITSYTPNISSKSEAIEAGPERDRDSDDKAQASVKAAAVSRATNMTGSSVWEA